MDTSGGSNISGAQDVIAVCGDWPSFHDAEILSVHLVRGGESTVTIKLMIGRPTGGPIVTFGLSGISELDLHGEDADVQNVIGGLSVKETPAGTTLVFWPCYGLSGQITARRVRVKVESENSADRTQA